MQTLEGLKRRIKTTSSLRDIVSSMKTLSAVSVGQYEKSTKALKQYYSSIELALQALLRNRVLFRQDNLDGKEKVIALILGSDQGLVGRFNKSIMNYAFDYLKSKNISLKNTTLMIGGKSLSSKVLASGNSIHTLFTMPSSVKTMVVVAKKIVMKLGEIQTEEKIENNEFSFKNNNLKVFIFYNTKDEHSYLSQNVLQLLPVDVELLNNLKNRKWPTKNLPMYYKKSSNVLFSSFIQQLLFVEIYKAISQSLAAEHFIRMISMQNAEKNIDEHLEAMNLEYQQRRQTEITNELLDVVVGAEVLNSKKNK